MLNQITSCSNQKIKFICSLHKRKKRDIENKFTFEGIKLFYEALNWNIPITEVFITELMYEKLETSCSRLKEQDVSIWIVSENVMNKLSTQKNPEGVLCCADKFEKTLTNSNAFLILEDVQDPGNVGTLIRTADAAGFNGVISTNLTADIYNDKVIRSSMGSVFHLSIFQGKNLEEIIPKMKQKGYTIIGTALDGNEELKINTSSLFKPVVILGNESKGMSLKSKKECDSLLRLPIYGHAESLNVSVAGGIVLYDVARKLYKK